MTRARSTFLVIVVLVAGLLDAPTATGQQTPALKGLTAVENFDTNPGNLNFYQYIPRRAARKNAALVVALHGCAGSAEQFSSAGFNELAEKYGFYVIYPEQRAENNSDLCFNHQIANEAEKERREIASVMQMIAHMRSHHNIAGNKIFLTGFSSGGQLANIIAATYPQLISAVSFIGAGGYRCETGHSGIRDFAECFTGPELPPLKGKKKRHKWPRASIWHAKLDKNVLFERMQPAIDQWSHVHRIVRRRQQQILLPGNIVHKKMKGRANRTLVETYTLNTMAHTVPITRDCGKPGKYFTKEKICFARQSIRFFGIRKPR